jgi:transposase
MPKKELISISQKELDPYQIISKTIKKEITSKEAAEIIQVSYRHFKRLKRKVKKEGAKSLIYKNRGKESKKKIPRKEKKLLN